MANEMNVLMADLDKQVAVLNAQTEPAGEPTEIANFVSQQRLTNAAMIEAAQHAVNEAQAVLEKVKRDAEQAEQYVIRKAQELESLRARIAVLGHKGLDAFKEFHQGNGAG